MAQDRIPAAPRRPSFALGVGATLRRMIVGGELVPGHPLSENEVAARLGVSRTPVREAFIKLEREGLIAVYPRYGSFVAPIRLADIHDSQFVRESIECAALAKATERLRPADAQALDAVLAAQRRCLSGDPAPFFEADEAFHAALLRIAGHERAWAVVEAAKGQHDRVRRLTVRDPLKRRAVLEEHGDILDRVLRRDAPGAVAAMRAHLRGVFASVQTVLDRHPEFFAATAESAAQVPRRERPQLPEPRRRADAGTADTGT